MYTRKSQEDPGLELLAEETRLLVEQASSNDRPVLLVGEPGTGKSFIARLIHTMSKRAGGPFVAVDLIRLPEELAGAELFGSTKGAFTGAIARAGLVEKADGGTLLFDELDRAPYSVQRILLGIFEEGRVRRLGESKERRVDVRLIACASSTQELSPDLLFRFDILIRIPSIRERIADLPDLIESLTHNKDPKIVFAPDAIEALRQYNFPGNYRELISIIENLRLSRGADIIPRNDLPDRVLNPTPKHRPVEKPLAELEELRQEIARLRQAALISDPIWQGRNFPTENDYCFVLMPFGQIQDLQDVYTGHVKRVLEERCSLRCARADDIYGISGVMQSVWESINRARVLVADLTGRNPNVFYELGIAHTMGKPVVMITQSMEYVPFDLRHLRCLVYEYKPGKIAAFELALEKTIKTVLLGTPVSARLELVQS